MKDNFSKQSSLYAKYRPDYPSALFEYILEFVKDKTTAWDCGTGNGQSAVVLSKYFKKVIATDISQKQLDEAGRAPNIFYAVKPAEDSGIESNSVNLITVAQAIHWFDFENFYKEVKRVATNDAVLAVWCYSLLRINDDINKLFDEYHFKKVGDYYDAERKYVDAHYATIPFPFEKMSTPSFEIIKYWTLQDFEGYLNTSSALHKYIAVHKVSPVPSFIESVKAFWPADETKKIIFPIHLLLGVIK